MPNKKSISSEDFILAKYVHIFQSDIKYDQHLYAKLLLDKHSEKMWQNFQKDYLYRDLSLENIKMTEAIFSHLLNLK